MFADLMYAGILLASSGSIIHFCKMIKITQYLFGENIYWQFYLTVTPNPIENVHKFSYFTTFIFHKNKNKYLS